MRLFALLLASIAAFGCTSERHRAYVKLADQLNPILTTMIPKVAAFAAFAPGAASDDATLYQLCRSADPELVRLGALNFDDALGLQHGTSTLALEAKSFLSQVGSTCWSSVDHEVVTTCRWSCLDRWSFLRTVLERVRDRAADEGVAIYDLPKVPPAKF